MVVSNLYPFQETVAQQGIALAEAIEQIDIGGVTLVRAAAKNFDRVTVVVDPQDYPAVLGILRGVGQVDADTARRLAVKAFCLTRDYDTAIHAYLVEQSARADSTHQDLPEVLSLGLTRIQERVMERTRTRKPGCMRLAATLDRWVGGCWVGRSYLQQSAGRRRGMADGHHV